jgi:DNA modification methylase
MGSLYRSKHELILILKNGTAPHINNVELGRFGRNRTNVWNYPSANSMRDGRRDELAMHPTVKPVAMVADAILDCSKRGGIVSDCFGGSGTTLIAAEKTSRRAYVMELDPIYIDTTIARFEKLTGQQAIHSDTGLTFAEMKLERMVSAHESAEHAEEEEAENVE